MRTVDHQLKDAVVLACLKRRYFQILAAENIPRTPELTVEADLIEDAVRDIVERASATQLSNAA